MPLRGRPLQGLDPLPQQVGALARLSPGQEIQAFCQCPQLSLCSQRCFWPQLRHEDCEHKVLASGGVAPSSLFAPTSSLAAPSFIFNRSLSDVDPAGASRKTESSPDSDSELSPSLNCTGGPLPNGPRSFMPLFFVSFLPVWLLKSPASIDSSSPEGESFSFLPLVLLDFFSFFFFLRFSPPASLGDSRRRFLSLASFSPSSLSFFFLCLVFSLSFATGDFDLALRPVSPASFSLAFIAFMAFFLALTPLLSETNFSAAFSSACNFAIFFTSSSSSELSLELLEGFSSEALREALPPPSPPSAFGTPAPFLRGLALELGQLPQDLSLNVTGPSPSDLPFLQVRGSDKPEVVSVDYLLFASPNPALSDALEAKVVQTRLSQVPSFTLGNPIPVAFIWCSQAMTFKGFAWPMTLLPGDHSYQQGALLSPFTIYHFHFEEVSPSGGEGLVVTIGGPKPAARHGQWFTFTTVSIHWPCQVTACEPKLNSHAGLQILVSGTQASQSTQCNIVSYCMHPQGIVVVIIIIFALANFQSKRMSYSHVFPLVVCKSIPKLCSHLCLGILKSIRTSKFTPMKCFP